MAMIRSYTSTAHTGVIRSTAITEEIALRSDVRLFKVLLEYRDRETAFHSIRVAEYAAEIATRLFSDATTILQIGQAALLHDIGKLAIPDVILKKEGHLTDEERDVVKNHAGLGGALVALQSDLLEVAPLVRHHHERYDGLGYPDGLRGEEIPIGSRIISVVDAFDAMTVDRPYRLAMRVQDATEELLRHSGSQFDPSVVKVFTSLS